MATPADKKRELEESRARALEYQASLKRKSAEAAGSTSSDHNGNPPSSKKARTKATPKGKSKSKARARSAPQDAQRAEKVAKRLVSRKHAEKYGQSLTSGKRSDEVEGTSDEGDNGSDGIDMDTDTYVSDAEEPAPTPTPAKPSPSPAAPTSRTGCSPSPAVRPSHSTQGVIPSAPPMPATSTSTSSRRSWTVGRSTHQPSTLPNGNGNNGSGSRSPATDAVGMTGHRPSFLEHAKSTSTTTPATTTEAMAGTEDADPVPSVLNDSRRKSGTSETTAGPAGLAYHNGSGRRSFLDSFRAPSPPRAPADHAANVGVSVAERQHDEEPAVAHRHGVEAHARAQGRDRLWALNCAVALAPMVFFFVLSGVLRAWPHVQVGVGEAWGTLRGFAARNPAAEKCFLLPSERDAIQAVCKKGAEVVDCPEQATCGRGKILACNIPLEKKMDGSACVLNAVAKEEVDAVIEALRVLTIEQLCKGNGLIMPGPKAFSTRSFITLTDAASAQNRGPLSVLAGMPPGNVAGLIDLEGEAAPDFGGGGEDDGVEGNSNISSNKGFGSERIARLSEGAYNAVMLTPSWRCRVRLAAGSWFMRYWPYCLGLYVLVLIVGCLDLRRLKNYKKHVQVCIMRDEAYRALLAHADKDSNPMQVSHIQVAVGDKRRASGEGSQATIQQNISELWPLVVKEVEHDVRIRRNFKSLMGQRSVACWQWIGSAGTSFDSIGALDPGRPPRLWLLRWLN